MTANPPTITTPPGREYTEDDLVELAKQFPEFSWFEAAEDRFWLADEQARGAERVLRQGGRGSTSKLSAWATTI